jgi:hypothetical protein
LRGPAAQQYRGQLAGRGRQTRGLAAHGAGSARFDEQAITLAGPARVILDCLVPSATTWKTPTYA